MIRLDRHLLKTLTWLSLAITASFCFSSETSFGETDSRPVILESVRVAPTPEGAAIEVESQEPFAYCIYTLTDPERLVIDPLEPHVQCSLSDAHLPGEGLIRSWSIHGQGNEVDYLVFDLSQPAEHLAEDRFGKLLVRVRGKGAGFPPIPSPVLAQAPQNISFNALRSPDLSEPPLDFEAPLVSENSQLKPGVWSIDSALEFGLGRHRPVAVAREEVELAEMKLREARRAMFPAATLKSSRTEGKASNVNFTEVSSGLQLEQPLYYSGRLRETYQQALVNLQVSEKRQNKVKADYALELTQAYFQLIGAQVTIGLQQDLVKQTEEFLEKTKKRFDAGLLTRLELLNVESQVNQANFQRATAQNDLLLARIKFLQRLGLSPDASVEVPSQFSPISQTPIDPEEALQLSAQYRPDIQVNSLLVEFQEYEVRIAKHKGKLKVDLSGFLGASGSAFQTEKLNLGKDYFIGIKATDSLGPHGATLSATKTKTSPRLGQTTRTDSTVYSAELGLISQLPGLSEIQQAEVNLEKARNEFEETKGNVYQEVQESFISYTKARLQLEYAKQRVLFRQEQLKILQAQASLNEIPPSQVLESIVKLADERGAQGQALTNYHVALAKMNKAIGLPGHYR